MGKKGDAIKYAKASCGLNDNLTIIDQVCERILLSSGLFEEAYQQYGLTVNRGGTNLATFRKIAKKYQMKEYINKIWNGQGYTADYLQYEDDSILKIFLAWFFETTGSSTF